MGSIEGAYIGLARYLMVHWQDQSWFRDWYCGIPYANTYPPLLHWMVALTGLSLQWSPAHAHHAVSAASYCLGAVFLYWAARRLSGDGVAAGLASLAFSLLSLSAFVLPGVRNDLATLWHPRRLDVLTIFGEGPHVTSLSLLPLALLALHWALERRRMFAYVLAAAALAAVVLSNWLGAFALAITVLCYLAARERPDDILRAAGIGIYGYLLALPWIPPSNIATVQWNAQRIGGDYRFTWERAGYQFAALLTLLAVWCLLRRTNGNWFSRFALLLTTAFGLICVLADPFRIDIMPQPHRYHLEFELALCLLLAAGLRARWMRLPVWAQVTAVLLILTGGYFQVRTYRRSLRYTARPIDITQRIEGKVARWLESNLPGQRVFLNGSVAFWALAFADVPQFAGGFDQGRTNRRHPGVAYQITAGISPEIATVWLKAYGVRAVVTSGPASQEFYKDFLYPRKFDGYLELLWREGDDAIYRVPSRSEALAGVVDRAHLVSEFPAEYAPDTIVPYVRALDDPAMPVVEWRWESPVRALAGGVWKPHHVLSVHMSYHPGWRASVNGQPRRVSQDALGQIVVEPHCDGGCTVVLEYDGGWEGRIAKMLHGAAFGVALIVFTWPLWIRLRW